MSLILKKVTDVLHSVFFCFLCSIIICVNDLKGETMEVELCLDLKKKKKTQKEREKFPAVWQMNFYLEFTYENLFL